MLSQLTLEIELLSVQFLLMISFATVDVRAVLEQLHVCLRLKLSQIFLPQI
jgi:hypothetical protein